MDYEKLFDLMAHRYEKPEENYTRLSGISLNPKQQEEAITKSIQAFIHGVAAGEERKPIQAFSGSTDLPVLTKDVFNVTMQTNNFDLGWQQSFRGVRLMKGQLSWEIATVSDPAEFELTPEGAKCRIGSVSGSTVTASIQKYSKGLGITWEMMEGRKLYRFVEALEGTRDKLYGLWAKVHYGLLATAGAVNQVAWQAGTNIIDRDIATLNLAAYTLANNTKDSGYGDTANATLLFYVNPSKKARINAALRASLEALVASGTGPGNSLSWNIIPVYTFNSQIPADKGILVLPGNKIQNSVYLQELGLKKQDIESLNEIRTYWTAFGAIIADNKQCVEVALA